MSKTLFRRAKKTVEVSVGESVRIVRELQGLSQNQLAQLTGISQSTISGIENDRVNLAHCPVPPGRYARCRCSTPSGRTTRSARAVALGMHDLGRVLRERLSSLLVLLRNEPEYPLQLDECGLTRVH